jgi:hypothetical protein
MLETSLTFTNQARRQHIEQGSTTKASAQTLSYTWNILTRHSLDVDLFDQHNGLVEDGQSHILLKSSPLFA